MRGSERMLLAATYKLQVSPRRRSGPKFLEVSEMINLDTGCDRRKSQLGRRYDSVRTPLRCDARDARFGAHVACGNLQTTSVTPTQVGAQVS